MVLGAPEDQALAPRRGLNMPGHFLRGFRVLGFGFRVLGLGFRVGLETYEESQGHLFVKSWLFGVLVVT